MSKKKIDLCSRNKEPVLRFIFNKYMICYFGNIATWKHLLEQGSSAQEDFLYTRNHKLNRTTILSANGPQTLSIPLVGGRDIKKNFSTVSISYQDDWQKNHAYALQSAYGRSAYWEHYSPKILQVIHQNHISLQEKNYSSFIAISEILKVKISENIDRNTDIKSFHFVPYFQVFSDKFVFIENLSILDLIMNKGPQSIHYLTHLNPLSHE
jgi:hypothetical protein